MPASDQIKIEVDMKTGEVTLSQLAQGGITLLKPTKIVIHANVVVETACQIMLHNLAALKKQG